MIGNVSMDEVSHTSLPLLEQGLDLMLYGMGVVFVFLAILVTAITLIPLIIHRLCPDDKEMEVLPEQSSSPITTKGSETLLKILQNAIDQHRDRH